MEPFRHWMHTFYWHTLFFFLLFKSVNLSNETVVIFNFDRPRLAVTSSLDWWWWYSAIRVAECDHSDSCVEVGLWDCGSFVSSKRKAMWGGDQHAGTWGGVLKHWRWWRCESSIHHTFSHFCYYCSVVIFYFQMENKTEITTYLFVSFTDVYLWV